MTSFNSVVKKYAEPKPVTAALGSDETTPEGPNQRKPVTRRAIDKENLRKDLEGVKKDNRLYFLVCVIMIALLFVVSVGVILANLHRPDVIKVMLGAFGISTSGLIAAMIRLWRVKTNTEFLMLLALNMDAETVTTVINILSRRL